MKRAYRKLCYEAWCHFWATKMTIMSLCRYFLGIYERRKMGMSPKQAADRAFRWEMQRIKEIHAQIRNAAGVSRVGC